MSPAYADWIAAHVPTNPVGLCASVTASMITAFPELRRVRGHYTWTYDQEPWPHWWCVAPDGTIVDPTAAQWPDGGIYFPHDESGPEPTGRCPNCGGYCYDHQSVCSIKCGLECTAYLLEEWKRP